MSAWDGIPSGLKGARLLSHKQEKGQSARHTPEQLALKGQTSLPSSGVSSLLLGALIFPESQLWVEGVSLPLRVAPIPWALPAHSPSDPGPPGVRGRGGAGDPPESGIGAGSEQGPVLQKWGT